MARYGGANNLAIMIISNNNHVVSPKLLTRTSTPNTLLERFIFSIASDASVGNREQKRYKYEEECDDGNGLRVVRFPCQVPWVIAAKTPSFMSLYPTPGSLVCCIEIQSKPAKGVLSLDRNRTRNMRNVERDVV